MPKKMKLVAPTTLGIQFATEEARHHFWVWLCEQGEQDYWTWMEARECESESEDMTVLRFDYEYADGSGLVLTKCGRLDGAGRA